MTRIRNLSHVLALESQPGPLLQLCEEEPRFVVEIGLKLSNTKRSSCYHDGGGKGVAEARTVFLFLNILSVSVI